VKTPQRGEVWLVDLGLAAKVAHTTSARASRVTRLAAGGG